MAILEPLAHHGRKKGELRLGESAIEFGNIAFVDVVVQVVENANVSVTCGRRDDAALGEGDCESVTHKDA